MVVTAQQKTVPSGYKQTDVGMIPDEWEIATIEDLASYITVGFVGSMSALFVKEGVPLLRGQNILAGSLDLTNLKFISRETHREWRKSALQPGDVVVVPKVLAS
jgi:type I restriction enzyme S subunit